MKLLWWLHPKQPQSWVCGDWCCLSAPSFEFALLFLSSWQLIGSCFVPAVPWGGAQGGGGTGLAAFASVWTFLLEPYNWVSGRSGSGGYQDLSQGSTTVDDRHTATTATTALQLLSHGNTGQHGMYSDEAWFIAVATVAAPFAIALLLLPMALCGCVRFSNSGTSVCPELLFFTFI